MIRRLLFLFLPVVLVSCTGVSTTNEHEVASNKLSPNGSAARIDAVVARAAAAFMKSNQYGGLSLGIVCDGVTHFYNFGELEQGTGRSPTENTLYAIASITKTFTGILLAQAVEEGKMHLDDDVRKYLEGNYPDLEYQGQPIQLVQLLCHNSGLPFSFPPKPLQGAPSMADRSLTRAEFFAALREFELTVAPGTKFQYSNVGSQLLGYILERSYGKSYEDLVEERIAIPLGMRNTKITLTPAEQLALKGYDEKNALVTDHSEFMQAAAGLRSTAADLLKYAQWQVVETDPAVRLSHRPMWELTATYSLGLNWQMFSLPDYRYIWQEGSLPGFSSYCLAIPEFKLGVVALMNKLGTAQKEGLSTLVKQIVKELDSRATSLP